MDNSREVDIIVWGATGFTGRLVAEYLCKHYPGLRIGIGARDKKRLQAVKEKLPAGANVSLFTAESHDYESLLKMAGRTQVLITTVGPYSLHGEMAVKACIDAGTHYLDITGEPEFVKRILSKYGPDAHEKGVLVINCCGFDSIPADLGAFYTAGLLPRGAPQTIYGYMSFRGQFSGGTLASALEVFAGDPKASLPNRNSSARKLKRGISYSKELSKWVIPMPVIDPWMVQRSAQMRPDVYGKEFAYAQFLTRKRLYEVAGLMAVVGGVVLGSRLQVVKNALKNMRPSGEGPDEKTRANSFFKVQFTGEGGGKKVRTIFSGGDPGYTETSKMVSECAVLVLESYDKLKINKGIVTPAAALGDLLIERLRKKGLRIEEERS